MALPFEGGLVIAGQNGGVFALDVPGRCLWEALQAGCTIAELAAGAKVDGSSVAAARTRLRRTVTAWRNLGLLRATNGAASSVPTTAPLSPPQWQGASLLWTPPIGSVTERCVSVVTTKPWAS